MVAGLVALEVHQLLREDRLIAAKAICSNRPSVADDHTNQLHETHSSYFCEYLAQKPIEVY